MSMLDRSHRAPGVRPGCAWLLVALGAGGLVAPAAADQPIADQPAAAPAEGEVTLAALLAHAERHASSVELARARTGLALAAQAEAAPWLPHNPTLQLGAGPRFEGSGATDVDFVASLEQELELGGQRGLRRKVAARLEERLQTELGARRAEVRATVRVAYFAVVVAQERAAVERRLAELADQTLAVARKRLAAGDATLLETRLCEADAAGAHARLLDAEHGLLQARIALAESAGMSPEAPPRVRAVLEVQRAVPDVAALLRVAAARHPELRARQAAVHEAEARVALAERQAWIAPTLGIQAAREGASEGPASYTLIGTVALPLPLWQSHQGERAQARADQALARTERELAGRALAASIARSQAALSAASARVSLLSTGVSLPLEEGLSLLQRGFDAGELTFTELTTLRDRMLQAKREALDAYDAYYRARGQLELALGADLPDDHATLVEGGAP